MWEIYAYQNADSLFGIFNAAAAIHGSGDYMAAVAAVAFCGFISALVAYAFAPEKLQGWKWLATVLLVFSVLIVPRVTVGVVDKTGGSAVKVVANVPLRRGLPRQRHQHGRAHAHGPVRDGLPGHPGCRRPAKRAELREERPDVRQPPHPGDRRRRLPGSELPHGSAVIPRQLAGRPAVCSRQGTGGTVPPTSNSGAVTPAVAGHAAAARRHENGRVPAFASTRPERPLRTGADSVRRRAAGQRTLPAFQAFSRVS
jgi:hypothetical protein